MKSTICIGDFIAEIEYPSELRLPENFRLFACSMDGREHAGVGEIPAYHYHIQLTDVLPGVSGTVIARRDDLIVLRNETEDAHLKERNGWLETRVIGVHGLKQPYAIYREVSEDTAEIYYLRSLLSETAIDTIFTSLLALERRMLKHHALVLHCAYIRYRGEAILFSAPSETGKSTQADLWEQYRGSRTINGDKALLQKVGGSWIARGWPICGSSEICHNEDTKIRAIVMLSQSPENHSGRLSALHAFGKLYSQITVNTWNADAVDQVMDLIGDIQNNVPVYELQCNISEDAVACLEEALNS